MVDISSFLGNSSLQTERRIHRRTNDMRSCSGATIKHRFLRLDWRERERGKYYMSTYSAPSLATVTAYVRGGDLRSFLQWRETLLRPPSRDGKGQRKKTAAVRGFVSRTSSPSSTSPFACFSSSSSSTVASWPSVLSSLRSAQSEAAAAAKKKKKTHQVRGRTQPTV